MYFYVCSWREEAGGKEGRKDERYKERSDKRIIGNCIGKRGGCICVDVDLHEEMDEKR